MYNGLRPRQKDSTLHPPKSSFFIQQQAAGQGSSVVMKPGTAKKMTVATSRSGVQTTAEDSLRLLCDNQP